jgi:2-haloacid dehalogenase
MDEIEFATFDCYGTLIDWEGGAAAFLYSLARRFEQDPPPGRVLRERWEEIQFELLHGDYAPYREVLGSSLRAWAEERGYEAPDDAPEAFALAMESWQPFPDTVPALRAA